MRRTSTGQALSSSVLGTSRFPLGLEAGVEGPAMSCAGVTRLPMDLDIFWPWDVRERQGATFSSTRKPWVMSVLKGSC